MRGVMLFQPVGFNPDYAVHPGEVLRETLDEGHLTQVQIAEACGVSQKHISEVVNGKAGIRASLAIALERALHVDARFWCRLQADWEVHRARLSTDTREEPASDGSGSGYDHGDPPSVEQIAKGIAARLPL